MIKLREKIRFDKRLIYYDIIIIYNEYRTINLHFLDG